MFGYLFNLKKIREKAHDCKHDPDKRKSVSIFGVHSIIYSLAQVGLSYGCFYSLCGKTNTGTGIFLIVLGFILLAFCLYTFLGSLFYLCIQLYLNKKLSGWIALTFFLIALANSLFILLYF